MGDVDGAGDTAVKRTFHPPGKNDNHCREEGSLFGLSTRGVISVDPKQQQQPGQTADVRLRQWENLFVGATRPNKTAVCRMQA